MLHLGALGLYGRAAEVAARFGPALAANPSVAIEAARMRTRQGDLLSAVETLGGADLSLGSSEIRYLYQLESLFLKTLTWGRFHQAIGALEGLKTPRESASDPATATTLAEAELVRIRLLLMLGVVFAIPAEHAETARRSLPELATRFAGLGRRDLEATALQLHAQHALTHTDRHRLWAALTDRQGQTTSQIALAKLRQGEESVHTGIAAERVLQLFADAEELYREAMHTHGPIDVAVARTRFEIQRGRATIRDLLGHVRSYRSIDHPKGFFGILPTASALAGQQGDLRLSRKLSACVYRRAANFGLTHFYRFPRAVSEMAFDLHRNAYREVLELGAHTLQQDLTAFQRGIVHQNMSAAYAMVPDFSAALHHGELALEHLESADAEEMASVTVLPIAQSLAQVDPESSKPFKLLDTWRRRDLERGDSVLSFGKLDLAAQLHLLAADRSDGDSRPFHHLRAAQDIVQRAYGLLDGMPSWERAHSLGEISYTQGRLAVALGDLRGAEQAWSRAAEAFASGNDARGAANSHFAVGMLHHNRANREPDGKPSAATARDHFQRALARYQTVGLRDQEARTRWHLASLDVNQFVRGQGDTTLLPRGLHQLEEASDSLDAIRFDYAAATIAEGERGRRALAGRSRQVHELALKILTRLQPDPPAAWRWVQRAKARALVDTLGTTSAAPVRLLSGLQDQPMALELAQRERDLVLQIKNKPLGNRLDLRRTLESLRQEMADIPALSEYLAFRLGDTLAPEDLQALLQRETEAGNGWAAVDWFEENGRLWLAVLDHQGRQSVAPLATTPDQVADFVHRWLGPDDLRETLVFDTQRLESLAPLVEPLAALTHPGDLLLLCPTGLLNSLPLHVLTVDGDALLARNPVVYTPSLGVLRHCLARQSGSPLRTAALIGNPSGDRESAGAFVQRLGEHFDASTLAHLKATRTEVVQAIADKDLIHFQGHAAHEPEDPLSSYLELADGPLPARDLFELPDVRADLVVLGACEGALNRIHVGDEPLGLIPALLIAGANAVVASLWPVRHDMAAAALGGFYSALWASPTRSKAHALREAMLTLRADRSDRRFATPWVWGAFSLHGAWR